MNAFARTFPFVLLMFLLGAGELSAAGFPTSLPKNARQWNEQGNQLAGAKQWPEAIEAFSQAIQLAPDTAAPYVNRAMALQRLAKWEEAETDCSRAIQLDAENTKAFVQRALVRAELGRNEDAFQDASRAARMEPENAQCVFIRHFLASRTGRHDLGHTAGETYIGIHRWEDKWSPYVALLNYVSLRRAGNIEAARAILAEAAAMANAEQWPMPVVFHLRGELDEPALLALAKEPSQATIARYYMGVRAWLDGDTAKARPHLEWVSREGDSSYLQVKLAADHLREMDSPEAVVRPVSKE